MTKSSAERWLRLKLGPDVRVVARDGDVRIVHDKDGKRTVIGRGETVDAALASTLSAARDAVKVDESAAMLQVRATARTPLEAFSVALHAFWAALLMWLAPKRLLRK